jgi:cell division protein FtsQ
MSIFHRFLLAIWNWRVTLVLTSLLGLIFWFTLILNDPLKFPIRYVKVGGDTPHLTQFSVKSVVEPYAKKGFFSINLIALRRKLIAIPWVGAVDIRRKWPSTLSVQIKEAIPMARWNLSGLVTAKGDLFYPRLDSIPKSLPELRGNEENKQIMVENYAEMKRYFSKQAFSIKVLTLSPQFSWRISLNNGVDVILGAENVLVRSKRFVSVYEQLKRKGRPIKYIDMRYRHGVAVKWG